MLLISSLLILLTTISFEALELYPISPLIRFVGIFPVISENKPILTVGLNARKAENHKNNQIIHAIIVCL